jgi:YD repeat-containing protein
MGKIRGSQGFHVTSYSPNAGTPYPWEGNVGGVNTGNGNKLTEIPIVGWTQRGGLPISFYLTHNSQSTHNSELGEKFTFSYDLYLMSVSGGVAVHWGDDQSYTFTSSGSSFSPPTGIHDSLVKNVDSTYTLTKPDQTQYHYNTSGYCDTITDENSNQVSIAHNAGGYVTSITDCTSRAITLGYNGSNEIISITDPLSRVWTIAYSGSNLASVTYPELGASYYSESFSYNAGHDITGITTPGCKISFKLNTDSLLN